MNISKEEFEDGLKLGLSPVQVILLKQDTTQTREVLIEKTYKQITKEEAIAIFSDDDF